MSRQDLARGFSCRSMLHFEVSRSQGHLGLQQIKSSAILKSMKCCYCTCWQCLRCTQRLNSRCLAFLSEVLIKQSVA